MPKISVIVPVYNVEKYLNKCIDSILAQTFSDFELILVDDGSPDNCGRICDEYARKDNKIHVIHKQNGGLSSARNSGLSKASGTYVMFCDSDDYVAPNWCELLYNAIQIHPNSCIVSNVCKVYENKIKSTDLDIIIDANQIQEITYFDLYKKGLSGFTVNKIYNLNILNSKNIRFDENCFFAEDVEFNVKYCQNIDSYYFIPLQTYYYLDNPNGIMNTFRPDQFENSIRIFNTRLPLIEEKDLSEYCDIWLYQFINLFDNIFDKRNKEIPLIKKLSYNQKMLKTNDFQYCVSNSSESKRMKLILKNYYLFWIYQKLKKN